MGSQEGIQTAIEEMPSPAAPALGENDEAIYVAVGKEKKDAETILSWVLHNYRGKKIFVLHVHSPAQRINMMGAYVPTSRLDQHQVRAHHASERQNTHKMLEEYISLCRKAGVRAEKLYTEMDSIEKGIVELILLHGIKKLVMGAARNGHFSKKMMEPRSKKAMYVRLKAPAFCHICFVCNGQLIHTREAPSNVVNTDIISPAVQAHSTTETGQAPVRSRSIPEKLNSLRPSIGFIVDHRRVRSDNSSLSFHSDHTGEETPQSRSIHFIAIGAGGEAPQNGMTYSLHNKTGGETPQKRILHSVGDNTGGETPQERIMYSIDETTGDETLHNRISIKGSPDRWYWTPRKSASEDSHLSSCSSSETGDDLASVSINGREDNANKSVSHTSHHPDEKGSVRDVLYDRLQQYVKETESARRAANEESIRCIKAENEALESRRRAKASETMLSEESSRKREIQELLERGKEEVECMKLQLNEVKQSLKLAVEQKSSIKCQIENSEKAVKDLEDKMFASVNLLQKYKGERKVLELERDNALREAEDLRKSLSSEASTATLPCVFSEYSLAEIEEATHSFDPAMQIGQGGYGSFYRGVLHHTQVAVKVLHPDSLRGPTEFQQEVDILSNMRHPHLITIVGVCREVWGLIYEYLPNGSLEDRLSCKDNSPPLSWQARIRIAAELCSVLMFLHCCRPQGIIHGDLKPANILLDANYVSKLSDFGICRVISERGTSGNNSSFCHRTVPKGTSVYMDPEFLATGELTPKSDVYSFGIILLRLLTGKSTFGIRKEVQSALEKGNLKDVLDPTAGDWPYVQAKQLAHLALSCCEMSQGNRPELASEVWRVLEPMRVSCGASITRISSEKRSRVPSYYICSIFQEIMRDPMVAADGYTYEAEAIRGWLDSGNDTSPMTNHKLSHSNLVPNLALRSAIQEWLQEH